MEQSAFHEWLDLKLRDLGWSRYRLAKESGIPQSTISRMMHGEPPTLETCKAIAAALHVDPVDLLYLSGNLERTEDRDLKLNELKALYLALDHDGKEDALFLLRDRLKYQKLKAKKRGRK